jgi:glutathione S-transferase
MKLHGNPMSTCTRKVLATFAEKAVKPEFVHVDFMAGAHKAPAHLAYQPFGQVPALEDGDFKLYESRAIMRYLDEVLPGTSLTPKDPKEHALMEQWISVETSNFTPHAMTLIYQLFFNPMRGQPTDAAKLEEGRVKLAPALAVLDAQLAQGPHLVGEQFTLADICFMPYIEYVMQTSAKDVILGRPNVAAWWKRISERPSWAQATGKV